MKARLNAGEPDETIQFLLGQATADDLRLIREQKLLLVPVSPQHRSKVAEAYVIAAKKLLTTDDALIAANYADFAIFCTKVFQLITGETKIRARELGRVGKRGIIELAEDLLSDFAHAVATERKTTLGQHVKGSPREQSEISEHLLHEVNGLNNDVHWATMRALNEALKFASEPPKVIPTRKERDRGRDEFLRFVVQSSQLNSLQYLLDKVSYGEWTVREISGSPSPMIKFEITDLSRERAKLIGIRRRLSNTMRRISVGANEVQPLEEFGVSCAIQFLTFYLRSKVTNSDLIAEREDFRSHVKILLAFFDKSDDLLIGASGGDFTILGEYLVAILLRGWFLARRKAASSCRKGQRARIRDSSLPLSVCTQIAEMHGWPYKDFVDILKSQTTDLPTENYYDAVRRPFFRCGGHTLILGDSAFNDWPAEIRSRTIRGGETAKRYGTLLENYCSKLFSDFGWLILGRNLKIRRDGRVLTDIDILTLKNGLLHVIQVKGLGIGAMTVYEQWLARSKITQGTEQATLAICELKQNAKLLRSLLPGGKDRELPTQLQPLVLTNSTIFTGWAPMGVPVASIGSLVSILNGATVRYTTEAGAVVSTEKFIKGPNPEAKEFLELLTVPLDWRIAEETEQVEYREVRTDFATCFLPELERRKRPVVKLALSGAVVANVKLL